MLNFFASYLQQRTFHVKYNGSVSNKFSAPSGVPQGSNLGPLLFVIFINDIPDVIKYSTCLLFADDMKFYATVENYADCENLQKDLDSVYEWSIHNKLFLNKTKCNIMSITTKQNSCIYNYRINNETLSRVFKIKDLGLDYDNKFNFNSHMENIKRQSLRNLGFLIRQTKILLILMP